MLPCMVRIAFAVVSHAVAAVQAAPGNKDAAGADSPAKPMHHSKNIGSGITGLPDAKDVDTFNRLIAGAKADI